MSVALLSLLNSPPACPPARPPARISTHAPSESIKQLSTAAGKVKIEDNLNSFLSGRRLHFF